MLDMRLVSRVPKTGVNVAFSEPGGLSVDQNVGLVDMSHLRTENLTVYAGGIINVITDSTRVATQEILISTRSVISRNVRRFAPLFYAYTAGRSTYKAWTKQTGTFDLDALHAEIRDSIQILDRDNNKVSNLDWDLVVTQSADNKADLYLYTSRLPTRHETFKVKYKAIRDSDGEIFPNHIEVINATVHNTLPPGASFNWVQQTNGYTISPTVTPFAAYGIGLFYNGNNAYADALTDLPDGSGYATRLRLPMDAGGYWDITGLTSYSIEGLVATINELATNEWEAVPMSDNDQCLLAPNGAFVGLQWRTYPIRGCKVYQHNILHVKYPDTTNVRAMKPYNDSPDNAWYPRVDLGHFSQSATYLGNASKYVFEPKGDAVKMDTGLYTDRQDILDEKPVVLGPKTLALRRPNILFDSLQLYRQRETLTNVIEDYDQQNSVIFLNKELGDLSQIFASYSYEETSFIYRDVDLNPLGWNSPELFGKYVGLYMTPAEILGASTESFGRTVWHVVSDSLVDIVTAVNNVKFDNGEDAKALLLGIYRVGAASIADDLQLTDTRTPGGGLVTEIEPEELDYAREAEMFMDISMWNGEPYPPTAVVAKVPNEVFGTGLPDLRRDPSADQSGFYYPSGVITREDAQAKLNRYKAGGVIGIVSPEEGLDG
jgi:hypothetical protein